MHLPKSDVLRNNVYHHRSKRLQDTIVLFRFITGVFAVLGLFIVLKVFKKVYTRDALRYRSMLFKLCVDV